MTKNLKKKAKKIPKKPLNIKPIILAFAIISFAVCAFYHQIIFRTGHQWDDFTNSHGPYIMINCTQLASGNLPLWIPEMHGGFPNLPGAVPHWSYPGNILSIIFANDGKVNSYWLQLTILLHLVLLGFFAFLYFKHRKVNYWVAVLGGITICLGGHFAFTLHWPATVMGLCWIPLLLIFLDKYLETGKIKNICWTGILTGLMYIAGTPQWVLYGYLFISLYFFLQCFIKWIESKSFVIIKKLIIGLSLTFIIAGFVSAIRLVPEYELVKISNRAAKTTYKNETPWKMIANVVLPHAWGKIDGVGPQKGDWAYWGKPGHFEGQVGFWHYWENGNYVGFIPLIFFFISGFLLRKDKRLLPFFVIQIFAVCFSYGLNNYFHLAVVHLIPTFKMMRSHQRIMSLFSILAMPCLLVFCLDTFIKTPREKVFNFIKNKKISLVFSSIIVLICLIFLFYKLYNLAPGIAEKKIITKDFYMLFFVISSATIAFFLYIKNKINAIKLCLILSGIICLDLYASTGNFYSNPNSLEKVHSPNQVENFLIQEQNKQGIKNKFRTKWNGHQANMRATYFGIESFNGYASLWPNKWVEFLAFARKNKQTEKLYNLYNIRFDIDKLAKTRKLEDRSRTMLPRVYTVHDVKKADWPDVLPLIFTNIFNPKTSAYVSEKIVVQPEKYNRDKINIKKYEDTFRQIDVSMTSTGLLAFSEHNYPGWKAKLDGQSTKIVDVNGIFMGVVVPEGNHEIEVYFAPKSVYLGMAISGIAWCFFGFIFIKEKF